MSEGGSKAVRAAPDVLEQHLSDDETIFLNLETEKYFGLDATGTAMWTALIETGDTDRALLRLLEEFDVDEDTLRRDLEELVARLAGQGLLLVGSDALSAPHLDPPS